MSTVKEWLHGLADTNTSTDKDSTIMERLLHRVGYPKARVVVGIVYPKGSGPPVDIHTMAKMLIKVVEGEAHENNQES